MPPPIAVPPDAAELRDPAQAHEHARLELPPLELRQDVGSTGEDDGFSAVLGEDRARLGELTGTAPFRYSIMLFAIISGATVFGEYPDAWAAAGMCLVIGAGFYAAHREARLRNSARTPPP